MTRPRDWYVLDLEGDPTPGSGSAIRAMARSWSELSDDAGYAQSRIAALLGDGAVGAWIGEAGEAFRDKTGDLPKQLGQCCESYSLASDALTWWAGRLETHQHDADHALVLGRAARADLEAAQQRAQAAAASAISAGNAGVLSPTAVDPDPAKVREATQRLHAAQAASSSADSDVSAAQGRLDAARQMALDAKGLREDDARTTAGKIHEASDAGIPERSRWDKFKDWAGEAWDVIVQIAKVVVAVLGVVALIIGGPLAWVVFAAALLVLADTIMKYMQGKASLWDVAFAALSCIPGTKGLTTLAELKMAFQAGGLLGAAAHLGSSVKTAATGIVRMAQRFRSGALPAITRIFTELPSITAAARGEGSLLGGIKTFWTGVNATRSEAVNIAWASHIAEVGQTNPARAASLWQGSGPYPGVDSWADDVLPSGSVVEAGWPGTSGFTVPDGTIASVGNDAGALADGTQVAPNFDFNPPFRSDAMNFQMQVDVPAATSVTGANPQYGGGGLTQHYIPDFNAQVASGNIHAIDASGNVVPASLNDWGGLQLDLPNGPSIHMTNPYPASGIPSGADVSAQALSGFDFAPWASTPWRFDQAGDR